MNVLSFLILPLLCQHFASGRILAGDVVFRLLARTHPAASHFLSLIQGLEPAGQAGCLSPPWAAPLGAISPEIPPSQSQTHSSSRAWHQLSDLPAQWAPYSNVDTHVHTSASACRSPLQTVGSQRLHCSISFPFFPLWSILYLGRSCLHLSHQPLPSCCFSRTLTLSTPCCHSSSPVFSSLALCSFILFKLLTSNASFFFYLLHLNLFSISLSLFLTPLTLCCLQNSNCSPRWSCRSIQHAWPPLTFPPISHSLSVYHSALSTLH